MFRKFKLWLSGKFDCRACGKVFFAMTFGYGTGICPGCYNGEERFLELDDRYWLNRFLSIFMEQETRIQEWEEWVS